MPQEFQEYSDRPTKQEIIDRLTYQLSEIDDDKLLGVAIVISSSGETPSDSKPKLTTYAQGRWKFAAAKSGSESVGNMFKDTMEGFEAYVLGQIMMQIGGLRDRF
jgi:hypothetical protein